MAKLKTRYVCSSCGQTELKWFGKCSACEQWNTAVEDVFDASQERKRSQVLSPTMLSEPRRLAEVSIEDYPRLSSGFGEVDRTLGGGVVPGSVTLLGGEPGIGKSTLLIQVGSHLAERKGVVLYVSGEESAEQIKMRAQRLGLESSELYLYSETCVEAIIEQIESLHPFIVIVDSIQSVFRQDIPSSPGSVVQVRESAAALTQVAKSNHVPIVLVGHVTKEGFLAGPRVLEHLVDTVLHLEGERQSGFRLLRALKNRFGSTSEIGLFEMSQAGLREIVDTAASFLSQNGGRSPGSCISVSVEGTRPLVVEIQALTSPGSGFGAPRRSCSGIDPQRLAMILAVLEKRNRITLASLDVYMNIVGGVRISETAIDLASALAIAGSYYNKPLDSKTVAIGEIGLSGEIRPVRLVERRLKEAASLGFEKVLIPLDSVKEIDRTSIEKTKIIGIGSMGEALEHFKLG